MRLYPTLLCVLLTVASATPRWADAASAPPVRSQTGMVAADSQLASAAGVEIMAAGGNAADAAVATAFVLGVVHPFASGIGGGGFALYYDRESDSVTVFDFRELAPAAATRDMYVVDGVVQPELSLHTGLAVGVPGEVAGLYAIHQRFGDLTWQQVLAPAIRLADEGFEVGYTLAQRLREERELLRQHPELMRLFTDELGLLVDEGDPLRRPDLAATLSAIADGGPDAFYSGPIAEQIVSAVNLQGGAMTADDLAFYRVLERDPVVGQYRNFTLYTMPPPSSSGTTILATLAILEHFDLPGMSHNSSAHIHLLTEALQFAFADRAEFLGDPAFADVPVESLVAPELGAERASRVQLDRTLSHDEYQLRLAAPPDDAGTSHFSIVDDERNVVALTTTINTTFGSAIVAGSSGIVLNNEMDDFSAQPGVPNVYGLIGSEANAVAPGKRPLSSMSPTLIFRDGLPVMTVGGSGGPRIISATIQVLLNVFDFQMTIREAIEAPRIHHQWMPDMLFVEREVTSDVRENLSARGHDVIDAPFISAIQAIVIDADALYGASDPRKAGETVGY